MTSQQAADLSTFATNLEAAYRALRRCDDNQDADLNRLLDAQWYPGDLDELARNIRAIADANDTGTNP
jgi:hypothetical protein